MVEKFFVHMLNMLMLNALILHNKFATEKTTHEGFRETVVKNLVEEGIKTCNLILPSQISHRYKEDLRLSKRHYPSLFLQPLVQREQGQQSHVMFVPICP